MTDPFADAVVDTVRDQARGRALPRALTPFRHPGYRRLAVALVASTFGQGVWVVALVWEVIRIGGGPTQLSIVTTANAIGLLVPVLLAGAAPVLFAVVAVVWARMPAGEVAHPLRDDAPVS